jgi:putative FmdB family regulatory protein
MPTYDYRCSKCKTIWEVLVLKADDKPKQCPECEDENIEKVLTRAPSVKFIGPGFHQTDYNENHDWKGTDYDSNMRENDKQNKKLFGDKK